MPVLLAQERCTLSTTLEFMLLKADPAEAMRLVKDHHIEKSVNHMHAVFDWAALHASANFLDKLQCAREHGIAPASQSERTVGFLGCLHLLERATGVIWK